jgi:hypothetical protein
MRRFSEWLLYEERSLVDPIVLDSYEQAFQQKLDQLIRRTKPPDLRAAFEESIRTIQRPGRLSIGSDSENAGMVSPGEIPDRHQSHEPEMMNDLIELLRKQSTPNLHLVDLFYSILNKEGAEVQSRRFGMPQVARGKLMIVKTIE